MSNLLFKKQSTPDIFVSKPNPQPSHPLTTSQNLLVQIPQILPSVKKSLTNSSQILFGRKSSLNSKALRGDLETCKKKSQKSIARPTNRLRRSIFGEFGDEARNFLGQQKQNTDIGTEKSEHPQKIVEERYLIKTEYEEYPSPLRKNDGDLRSALNDLNALSLSPLKKHVSKKKSPKNAQKSDRDLNGKYGSLDQSPPDEEERQKEAIAIRRSSLLNPIMEQLKNETKLPDSSKKKILRKHQALQDKQNQSKKSQRFQSDLPFDHKKSSLPKIYDKGDPRESYDEKGQAQGGLGNSYRKMENLRKMETNLSVDTKFGLEKYFEENLLTATSRELLANRDMEPLLKEVLKLEANLSLMKSRTMGGKSEKRAVGGTDQAGLIDQKIRDAEGKFKLSRDSQDKVFKRGQADAFHGVETYIESDHQFKKFNLYNPDTSAHARFEGNRDQKPQVHGANSTNQTSSQKFAAHTPQGPGDTPVLADVEEKLRIIQESSLIENSGDGKREKNINTTKMTAIKKVVFHRKSKIKHGMENEILDLKAQLLDQMKDNQIRKQGISARQIKTSLHRIANLYKIINEDEGFTLTKNIKLLEDKKFQKTAGQIQADMNIEERQDEPLKDLELIKHIYLLGHILDIGDRSLLTDSIGALKKSLDTEGSRFLRLTPDPSQKEIKAIGSAKVIRKPANCWHGDGIMGDKVHIEHVKYQNSVRNNQNPVREKMKYFDNYHKIGNQISSIIQASALDHYKKKKGVYKNYMERINVYLSEIDKEKKEAQDLKDKRKSNYGSGKKKKLPKKVTEPSGSNSPTKKGGWTREPIGSSARDNTNLKIDSMGKSAFKELVGPKFEEKQRAKNKENKRVEGLKLELQNCGGLIASMIGSKFGGAFAELSNQGLTGRNFNKTDAESPSKRKISPAMFGSHNTLVVPQEPNPRQSATGLNFLGRSKSHQVDDLNTLESISPRKTFTTKTKPTRKITASITERTIQPINLPSPPKRSSMVPGLKPNPFLAKTIPEESATPQIKEHETMLQKFEIFNAKIAQKKILAGTLREETPATPAEINEIVNRKSYSRVLDKNIFMDEFIDVDKQSRVYALDLTTRKAPIKRDAGLTPDLTKTQFMSSPVKRRGGLVIRGHESEIRRALLKQNCEVIREYGDIQAGNLKDQLEKERESQSPTKRFEDTGDLGPRTSHLSPLRSPNSTKVGFIMPVKRVDPRKTLGGIGVGHARKPSSTFTPQKAAGGLVDMDNFKPFSERLQQNSLGSGFGATMARLDTQGDNNYKDNTEMSNQTLPNCNNLSSRSGFGKYESSKPMKVAPYFCSPDRETLPQTHESDSQSKIAHKYVSLKVPVDTHKGKRKNTFRMSLYDSDLLFFDDIVQNSTKLQIDREVESQVEEYNERMENDENFSEDKNKILTLANKLLGSLNKFEKTRVKDKKRVDRKLSQFFRKNERFFKWINRRFLEGELKSITSIKELQKFFERSNLHKQFTKISKNKTQGKGSSARPAGWLKMIEDKIPKNLLEFEDGQVQYRNKHEELLLGLLE